MPAVADDFMQQARMFLEVSDATVEQNQDYIALSNQFTAEGEFTAAELAELFLIRAVVFSRLKDSENAFESYFAALESGHLSPILIAETYKNRGLLFYSDAAYTEAKDDFEQALKILSGNAELHYYLANSYFGLSDFKNALNQYDLALDGMANNRFLAYYGKASIYYQQKQYEKSREILGKSLEMRSDFEPALQLLDEIDALNNVGLPSRSVVAEQGTEQGTEQVESKQLTANEIYNRLLKQALDAKQKGGDATQMKIKLSLTQDRIDNLTTATIPNVKKRPEVNLREARPKFNLHIPTIPPSIAQTQQSKLKNKSLNINKPEQFKGYFLQLSSGANQENAHKYYHRIVKKHGILLAKRPYVIRPFKNVKQQINYQLLLSGFQSYKQANSLCKFLKARNNDCFVRHIK
ncbi:MAG: SPOR domain-containing protein [Alphaproteobacteria bacterium]|nr:SPOR domain-containing protein [Alphaproteobacteria bacterium]